MRSMAPSAVRAIFPIWRRMSSRKPTPWEAIAARTSGASAMRSHAQLAGRKKCLSQRARRMNGHAVNRTPVQRAEMRTIARDQRVAALMDGGR